MLRMPYQKVNKIPVTFPDIISRSRDWNIIEILLYTIFYYFYNESIEIKNQHNPYRCKVELLPLLADYYRYSFTDVEDIDLEREIIANVPQLHHYKGTSTGIDNALALAKVNKENKVRIPWHYDKDKNEITVILFTNLEVYKLQELLKLVVPLGTKVVIKPGYYKNVQEEIQMHSYTEYNKNVKPDNYYAITQGERNTEFISGFYRDYVKEQKGYGNPEQDDYSTRAGTASIMSDEEN